MHFLNSKNTHLITAHLIAHFGQYYRLHFIIDYRVVRLANVGILGKEREPGVGKLGWHGKFGTGFERNTVRNTRYFIQNPMCGFFELFEIASVLLAYRIVDYFTL